MRTGRLEDASRKWTMSVAHKRLTSLGKAKTDGQQWLWRPRGRTTTRHAEKASVADGPQVPGTPRTIKAPRPAGTLRGRLRDGRH